VSGTLDCTSFNSTYSIVESSISIGELTVTLLACELQGNEEYENQHSFIVTALSTVESYHGMGSRVVFKSVDSSELVFEPVEE